MKRKKSDFRANFGPKKDLDGLRVTTLQYRLPFRCPFMIVTIFFEAGHKEMI